MRKMIVFLSIWLALAMIFGGCAQSTQETPTVPEPSEGWTEETETSPTETPLPIIEVEWKTGGPYGERPRLSSGINGLFIDSEDGSVVRAIEYLAVWKTTTGGKTWEKLNRELTQEEMDVFAAQPLSTDTAITIHEHENPVWESWEHLVTQFPSLRGRFTGAFPSIDPNNSNNVFVAIVIPENPVYPNHPDNRPSRLKEFPPHGIITRLFLSLDGGRTFREITTPSSNWTATWRLVDEKGNFTGDTFTAEHNLGVGATALVSYKGSLKLYIGLVQRWDDIPGGSAIVWQATLPLASLLD